MASYPGDLTPEQKTAWTESFRRAATGTWGAERAQAIDETLSRAAIAVGRLDSLQMTPTDVPAFFLINPGGMPEQAR
jgi:hypothetical protein